jgi:hypothetical protein
VEPTGDGIDEVCDPNPFTFDGTDFDNDTYGNRGDNCPLDANGLPSAPNPGPNNQQDLGEFLSGTPVDGGPASDGIGDVCDLNPTVADGHFHTALKSAPTCVGLADSDTDGWCDLSEGGLGSNPASSMSTPEALAVPGSCSDGADNDIDGNTDLNDGAGGPAAPTGCQLPAHDVAIKKVNSDHTTVCSGANATTQVKFNVILQNNGPAASENVELGITLDSVPSYIPTGAPPYAPSKSAGSVTGLGKGTITAAGALNVDGDADVEWLTKVSVPGVNMGSSNPVHVTVNFPACAAGPDSEPVDYRVSIDVCHAGDIEPLGLFGAGACGGASDGGQDRNTGNDAPVSRDINDGSR